MSAVCSIIFQSAKLNDTPKILLELEWAEDLLRQETAIEQVYGLTGGALPALAFALARSARMAPQTWAKASTAVEDFACFLRQARWSHLYGLNPNPAYGPFNLKPLRRWVAGRLTAYAGRSDLRLGELPLPLYLCALDQDAVLTLFGPPDEQMQTPYQFVQLGPPQDAPILDALEAALSTLLSMSPVQVNHRWYRDCRPAVADGGAIVADLEAADPRPILRTKPYTPLLNWKSNWFTSSFIMHCFSERNQPLLASYYLDLLARQRELEVALQQVKPLEKPIPAPALYHINLPYVGSTEAATNMRDSVAHKAELMEKFAGLLSGQLDAVRFDQPANLIYGAGGFSGILAGLVTTRAIDDGFKRGGGQVQQVYGVSAGVLNGFFHAVQLAAAHHPDLYRPAAHTALQDLENFVATISTKKFARINTHPACFWRGWANLQPLEQFLLERLAAYTGSAHPEQIRFDDIGLPMTVTLTRRDGFSEFLGMAGANRYMNFAGRQVAVRPAAVVKALVAGWSMNTYIEPACIDGEYYEDGGGAFYDIGLFPACMDEQLTNLINIHLDEPEGHSYNLPARPNIVRIIFDTHNYTFPEERRRMFLLSNLLYAHYARRAEYAALAKAGAPLPPLTPDFRRQWEPTYPYHEDK